ncbi:MAG: rRNA pseudouridine synthase [Clostridia bacterium]|nr:rRNA pseudouridine synthase [Clostridia bacterium]
MRIDKLISEMGLASRKEADKAARNGMLFVNGEMQKDVSRHIDPEKDAIVFCGNEIKYRQFVYILMNKPKGVVSATEDGRDKTVLDLLSDEYSSFDLFPCGRLDKYTTGLILLTNDGDLAHRLLSPKRHVKKAYSYTCQSPLSDEDAQKLQEGVFIEGGYKTKPCSVIKEDQTHGKIVIDEGKYHQIKQMFGACQNKITELCRISFGPLSLPKDLKDGEYRELTEEEISALIAASGR